MRRVGGLFDRICSRENIVAAVWRAAKGKRERPEIRQFLNRADDEINQITHQLASCADCFQRYRTFAVRDTKTREIHAPTFHDRVIHHAIVAVAGPVLEMGALHHSYACRKGRGQHAAIDQARQWTRRSFWYGKIDVRRYYDSINHDKLRWLLERRFSERRLLKLFNNLLRSYETLPGRGLPIGALTSQYLANFYLDEFDRRMKATRLVPRYVRYMDDIVLWSTRDGLNEIRQIATDELAHLKLTMKDGGQWNRCVRGLPFLGFVIYPDRVRVNKNGRRRLRKKLRAVRREFSCGRIDETELQQRLSSLFAHVRHGDDLAWRQAVLACLEGEAGEWGG